MTIPELTQAQADAAVLVRAIEVLDRMPRTWCLRWQLKRIVRRLAK